MAGPGRTTRRRGASAGPSFFPESIFKAGGLSGGVRICSGAIRLSTKDVEPCGGRLGSEAGECETVAGGAAFAADWNACIGSPREKIPRGGDSVSRPAEARAIRRK
ncbi:MAG TPA: hypothetical protein VIX89_06760 [Bryobacteraceae bacterium]